MTDHTFNALLVVDVTGDFLPGGSLPVPEGDQVIDHIVDSASDYDMIFLIRDYHPADHISFSDKPEYKDMSWPPHNVIGSVGSMFHPAIQNIGDLMVEKGTDPDHEAYSGFEGTDLANLIRTSAADAGVEPDHIEVTVVGLATDYCVKHTALDSVNIFRTHVDLDGCRGITPEGVQEAISVMREEGVTVYGGKEAVPA